MKKILFILMAMVCLVACKDKKCEDCDQEAVEDSSSETLTVIGRYVGTVTVLNGNITDDYIHQGDTIEVINTSGSNYNITFLRIKFSDYMPSLDITIPDLTGKYLANSETEIELYLSGSEPIVPLIGQEESENYTITDFAATLQASSGKSDIDLEMIVNIDTEKRKAQYATSFVGTKD